MDYHKLINNALKEDIGGKDITSRILIPSGRMTRAVLLAKESGVVCGLEVFSNVLKKVDKRINIVLKSKDGKKAKKGDILAQLEGPSSGILTGERLALNFLSLLSGIATQTAEFVNKVRPYKVKIMDTRKTIPGLRSLQKYAVRCGGGFNHRMSLDEMVLIKDNHIAIAKSRGPDQKSLRELIEIARKKTKGKKKIEIEVKNLSEFKEALGGRPDIIMLDNMKIPDIKKAVKIARRLQPAAGRILLEASGGITIKNAGRIAACGVDMISLGCLTHTIKSMDISLEAQEA